MTRKKKKKPKPQATKPKVEEGRRHRRHNNRKPKRSARAAKPTYTGEPMEQKPRIPVSLHEYFPKDFFQRCIVAACHIVEVKEPLREEVIAVEEVKTLITKEGLPTHVSIEEALRLPEEMRKALIVALASPNDHGVQGNKDECSRL